MQDPSESEKSSSQLRQSARTVTATLIRDEQQAPDLWDLLQSSYSRDYLPSGSAVENQLLVRQVHVIPDILLAQFEGKECKCFMGLLPSIGRVWMSIDNRLYLWDFVAGRDFTCFDELDQPIIDIVLVRPREGIFIPLIQHLLIVVTAPEIVLIGLSFAEGNIENELIIHRTGLFFPSDEVNMLSVVGSRTGRIFAGGQDGNLYEFAYQAEEGWFTRKCRKLNKTGSPLSHFAPTFLRLTQSSSPIISLVYDKDRSLLYALCGDSSIQLFSLGRDDTNFEKIAHIGDLFEYASRLCPAGIMNRQSKIVSINVVERHESAYVHLVAISSCGIKLYFTTLRRDERAFSRTQILSRVQDASLLELIHVRLPADGGRHRDARRMLHSLNLNIHTVFYSRGITLAASAISKQEDILIANLFNQSSMSTSFGHCNPFESVTDVSIDGKVWDIQESHQIMEIKPSSYSSIFSESISPLVQLGRTLMVLSNSGICVLSKSTPVEDLQRILIESNGNCESGTLKQFVGTYTAEQACFFLIVIGCTAQSSWGSSSTQNRYDAKLATNLSIWAVNALLRFGGEPRIIGTSPCETDFIGHKSHSDVFTLDDQFRYEFSALHRSLYIYFARLVALFWGHATGKLTDIDTNLVMALHSFTEFLERNPVLSKRTISKPVSTTVVSGEDAINAENESIKYLKLLVKATMELIPFILICRDYNIFKEQTETILEFSRINFEELVSTIRGRGIIAEIGSMLIQKQLKSKAPVDSLCQILSQRCPTFFGSNEIFIFHGIESLEQAKHSEEPSERTASLDESLKYFLRGSASLSLGVVSDITHHYQRLAYFPGIIELCLATAASHDPENVASLAIKHPSIELGTFQRECVNLRYSFYTMIFNALKTVHSGEGRAVMATLGLIDVDKLQKETLSRAIKSKDEIFHPRLYDWLIENKLGFLLLDIETPFLSNYLQSRFEERVESSKDLWWKYLARHGQYLAAAKVLDKLASSPEFNLELHERIERLSLALGNAKSEFRLNTVETAEYIQDLEERLEVAKLQHDLLENVISQYGNVAEVTALNSTLFDVTQLFNQFARPLKLWECALLILHCASYHDSLLVNQFWTSIIEKTLDGAGKRFDLLSQKIAELAKRLYPSPYAFPLNFIVDFLLVTSIKNEQTVDWIAATFTHTIIPVQDLLEQFVRLLQSQSMFWMKFDNREYLVGTFIAVAEKSPCNEEEIKRLISSIISVFPSTSFTGKLNRLINK